MTQVLEVNNFSGGMTDNYVDGPSNRFQEADNFFIDIKGKLFIRPGSAEYDNGYAAILPDSVRIDSLIYSKDQAQLYAKAGTRLYSKVAGTWQAVNDYAAVGAFAGSSAGTHIAWAEWNKHLYVTSQGLVDWPSKTYRDSGGTQRLVTAGLPAHGAFTAASTGGTGSTFIYAVVWYRTYTVGTVTYEDFGKPSYYQITNVGAPNVNQIDLSGLDTYANGTGEHFDTSAMTKRIFRTTNGGTTFFYVAEVSNATTTYADTTSDTTLQNNNITMYTEGGVQENDQPPRCKFLTLASDIMFYGHIKEGTSTYTNLVKHSKPGDPDSVPGSFEIEVKEEIAGLGTAGKHCIILCKNRIYRIDGFVDELGRGVFEAIEIDSSVGCVNHESIVPIDKGILFAGNNGFYFTDGYRVVKLTSELDTTYEGLVNSDSKKARIVGAHDVVTQRVWWATTRDDAATENDSCFVLDLTFGISQKAVFTTMSGGDHFKPTALAFDGSNMVRATASGTCAILKHDTSYTTDYDVANNEEAAIIWNYKSCAFSFGTTAVRKWVTRILASFQTTTDVSLQITSNNNDGQKLRDLQSIRFRENIVWGDPSVVWGDPTITWGFGGTASRIRRFPAGDLRCTYKQVILTNAYTNIAVSDDYGLATITAPIPGQKAVEIPIDFPANAEGYFIAFETDSYEEEFEVLSVSGDTVLVSDPSNHLTEGTSRKWQLKGYQKGEHFLLMSYVLYYHVFGPSHRSYHGAAKDDGGNA